VDHVRSAFHKFVVAAQRWEDFLRTRDTGSFWHMADLGRGLEPRCLPRAPLPASSPAACLEPRCLPRVRQCR